ncbi:MAG: hypothetical protein IIB17_10130 [Chloroflexi bacterium]|nr:hypothetical protein [Chloroflexota bacterium]
MIAENWPIGPKTEATESPESDATTLTRLELPGQAGIGGECARCGGGARMTDYEGDLFCMTCGQPARIGQQTVGRRPLGLVYVLQFARHMMDVSNAFPEFQGVEVQMKLLHPGRGHANGNWEITCPMCGGQRQQLFGGQNKRKGGVPRTWSFRCNDGPTTRWRRHATIVLSDRDGAPGLWFPRFN